MAVKRRTCQRFRQTCGKKRWGKKTSLPLHLWRRYHQQQRHSGKTSFRNMSKYQCGGPLCCQNLHRLTLLIMDWTLEETNKTLTPRTLPPDVAVAPPEVLELLWCGCSDVRPMSHAVHRDVAVIMDICHAHSFVHVVEKRTVETHSISTLGKQMRKMTFQVKQMKTLYIDHWSCRSAILTEDSISPWLI